MSDNVPELGERLSPFPPSAVHLDNGPPLCATMGRCEREYAAALIVWACQQNGDRWQPIDTRKLVYMLTAAAALNHEPVRSWMRNPALRPDPRDLADKGFARWVDSHTIELTEQGIESLRRWVLAPSAPDQPLAGNEGSGR